MRNPDIDHTFSAIRQAPLEVEYSGIEQFVLQQPVITPLSKTGLKNWLNNTNIAIVTLVTTALIASLLINRKTPEQINAPVAVTVVSPSPNSLPPLQDPATKKSPLIFEKKDLPESTAETSLAPQKPVILTDVRKTAAAMHPPGGNLKPSHETPGPTTEAALVLNNSEEGNAPLRMRTYTSSYCTFDGEDAWIKAFLKALISDNIIRDTVDLRFTITLHSFSVNGKGLDEAMVAKYNELYTAVTSEALNSQSKLSLSVGGSSCTLTKVMNE
ncbi:MAG TPA: hypothetical protein PLD84_09650 [Chitinophagales bacterium]|nr:hypothetical protein [Chitinophagales bacterium]